MTTVTDAIYENGVLRPLDVSALKENQRYHLILREALPPLLAEVGDGDPEFAAELERRTTVLPDGRTIIRLAGLFQADLSDIPEDHDTVAKALAELRRERAKYFDEKWPVPDEQTE
jgi:predicted DNA-binding antitoxin AbrB/MazE fold protein